MTTYTLLFFFTPTSTSEIYTLSLHDALPISASGGIASPSSHARCCSGSRNWRRPLTLLRSGRVSKAVTKADRKSTRLNSSHVSISYAVFCLKKKKQNELTPRREQLTQIVRPH